GERKGKINIRIDKKQGIITIELADNGIGIPDNVQINNTKTLGLKIVQALTEQINGSIELVRDSGTCFILSFKKK
ncbi:ATP-binding protein, partial [Verrucomicrobiota bacterium]